MVKYLLQVFIVAGFLVLGVSLNAQDVHFSQYNSSPLELNPALAGMNTCDYRGYANFRMQWPTVSSGNTFRTFAGGADMSVGKVTKYNSFAGIGISFFSDQAGAIHFNSNAVQLSLAYHFMLDRKGNQQISAGLQGAFNVRSINQSLATFDSQFDPTTGVVDPNGPRETFGRTKIMFGDAGLGLLYSAMVKRNTNIYLGFALNHVNQPKISFYPNGEDASTAGIERLYMKITIHGGAAIPLGGGDRLALLPNFLVLVQGPSREFDMGLSLKAALGNTKTSATAIYFGAQYRGLLDAVIINGRIDVKGFSCGLSYDMNVSKLLPATHTIGAPEISLMYQGCMRKKPHPGHCPTMF